MVKGLQVGGISYEELHQKDADSPWHVWGTQGMQTSAAWIEWWVTGGSGDEPIKVGCDHNTHEKYNEHCCLLHMEVVKRVNPKSFHHEGKKSIFFYVFNFASL